MLGVCLFLFLTWLSLISLFCSVPTRTTYTAPQGSTRRAFRRVLRAKLRKGIEALSALVQLKFRTQRANPRLEPTEGEDGISLSRLITLLAVIKRPIALYRIELSALCPRVITAEKDAR
jgi:hypothetical protein